MTNKKNKTTDQFSQTTSQVATETFKLHKAKTFSKRIKKQSQKIKKLINRIMILKDENEKLISTIDQLNQEIKERSDSNTFEAESDDYKQLADNTVTTIKNIKGQTNQKKTNAKEIHESNRNNKIEIKRKKKIYILADQQGRDIQQTLQKLVGSEFQVFCFWKSNAKMCNILNSCKDDLKSLDKNDFVVIMSGNQ